MQMARWTGKSCWENIAVTIEAYGNVFALLVFAIVLLPAVVLGLRGKSTTYYGMLVSIPVIYMLLGQRYKYFLLVAGTEIIILMGYYYLREKYSGEWLYYGTLLLLILPVAEVKLAGVIHIRSWAFLGISYFGFRVWQMVIEIHDGQLKELDWKKVLYFLVFFPTLSSGPIDRYRRFLGDINRVRSGSEYWEQCLHPGLKKIIWGVTYKFVFAEALNLLWLGKISKEVTVLNCLDYMYAYTFYLFFDFAGYSLMTVGTAYLLGVIVPDNFNKPFLARNMKEFWERWHISLSRWFGDYLFSRLVLNFMRRGWIKKQVDAVHVSYMITMFIMGIWHGFTLHYVLYGLYQGAMLVASDKWLRSKLYRKQMKKPWYDWTSRLICFQVIAFGMLLFSGYLIKN